MTKLAADVRALKPGDPPIVSTGISAPASYWLDLRGYDPPAAASRLTLPMLVLQGERDYQVTMEDHAAWQRAIGSRANVQTEIVPGAESPVPRRLRTVGARGIRSGRPRR